MSNQKKWFFLKNNAVSGPFDAVEIEPLAIEHPEGLIWGQGFIEWVPLAEWKETLKHLERIVSGLQSDMTPSWLIWNKEQVQGPFIYQHLLQVLMTLSDPGDALIKQVTDDNWKSIYEYPPIVEEVGITRRRFHRVPVSGLFKYKKDKVEYSALLVNISEGGLGLMEAENLIVGETIRGEVHSPQLATSFPCQCEVLYQQKDGNWGLRFVNIPVEYTTVIISYTRQFKDPSAA